MTDLPPDFDRSPAGLAARLEELSGWHSRQPLEIVTEISDAMRLNRGHVLDLEGRLCAVMGCAYETRFGISDQPKYWVLRCLDLVTGQDLIVKTVFNEEFVARIGPLRIRCYRSPKKESTVLELVRGDDRFMQGYTVTDSVGNRVRVIDHIRGSTIFNHVLEWNEPHERFSQGEMRRLLAKLIPSLEAIQMLHEHRLCHGDIRNDHLIIDAHSGRLRWIDFDLNQDFSDFDTWSVGNVLAYVVGQGIRSFHQVLRDPAVPDRIKGSLETADASAFYDYRIYNLRKLYPYLPERINDILLRFTVGSDVYYQNLTEVTEDLGNALA